VVKWLKVNILFIIPFLELHIILAFLAFQFVVGTILHIVAGVRQVLPPPLWNDLIAGFVSEAVHADAARHILAPDLGADASVV